MQPLGQRTERTAGADVSSAAFAALAETQVEAVGGGGLRLRCSVRMVLRWRAGEA